MGPNVVDVDKDCRRRIWWERRETRCTIFAASPAHYVGGSCLPAKSSICSTMLDSSAKKTLFEAKPPLVSLEALYFDFVYPEPRARSTAVQNVNTVKLKVLETFNLNSAVLKQWAALYFGLTQLQGIGTGWWVIFEGDIIDERGFCIQRWLAGASSSLPGDGIEQLHAASHRIAPYHCE